MVRRVLLLALAVLLISRLNLPCLFRVQMLVVEVVSDREIGCSTVLRDADATALQ